MAKAPKPPRKPRSEKQRLEAATDNTVRMLEDMQQRHIAHALATTPNPFTGQRGIALMHLRMIASMPDLKLGDNSLELLFKGTTAFDKETGAAADWAVDLASIVDMRVEELFKYQLQLRDELPVIRTLVVLDFKRTIGEHCRSLGASGNYVRATIATAQHPLQQPIKLKPHHQVEDAAEGLIRIRDEVLPIDEVLAIFDHAFERLPASVEATTGEKAKRMLTLRYGLDALQLEGDKTGYSLPEVAAIMRIPNERARRVMDKAASIIRHRVHKATRIDADGRFYKTPSNIKAKRIIDEREFTADEAIRILLEPDFQLDRHERARELLDEAKLLRTEQKQALLEVQQTNRAYHLYRSEDNRNVFHGALERASILNEHVQKLVMELDKFRDIAAHDIYITRRHLAGKDKPEPNA